MCRAPAPGRLPDRRLRTRRPSRANGSGTSSRTTTVSSACTISTIAAASTRSAIRCSPRSTTSSISPSSSRSASCCTCCCSPAPRCSMPSRRARRPADARCCARCARASTASCSSPSSLVAVLPVVILALATRAYFAAQFTAAVEEGAVRTATVAQRLVEDYATLQQRADRRAPAARRLGDGDRRPGDRSGGQPLRRRRAAGDQRARPLRVAACCRRARRPVSTGHRPRPDADLCRNRGGRRVELPDRRGAGARRRTRRHRHRAADAAAPGKRAADRRARSAGPHGGRPVRPARGRVRLLDGRTDCRPRESPDPGNAPHRARRSRREDRRDLVGRAAAARRGLQPHGGRPQAAARRARTDPASRGLGRHGAAGRARHQEPADADSALRRARAARQHRPRPPAVAGARRLRQRDPHAGEAAAADFDGVLQLRVLADPAAGTDRRVRADRRGRGALPHRA